MNRGARVQIAQETMRVLEEGCYRLPSGQVVDISAALEKCVSSRRVLRPNEFPDDLTMTGRGDEAATGTVITSETTLAAARRISLETAGADVLCLNFASAKNPGGGFLSGSQAQEESLARASGLYASIGSATEMYEHNRRLGTCLYSDHMIYSPRVPVFRDDDGRFLSEPYLVSFITAPAVNAGAVRRNEPRNAPEIVPTMKRRLHRVLWLARQMSHSTIILGAWGCGVFGNEPAVVAELFSGALGASGPCRGWFDRVVYAVYDRTPGQQTLAAFRRVLTCG